MQVLPKADEVSAKWSEHYVACSVASTFVIPQR